MSLPLFLVDTLPAGGPYKLDGPEGHHAAAVQRLRPGESLLLGDGRGGTATAVVEAAGRTELTVKVISHRYARPPAPRLVVAQGIAKGDRGELAVQAMTEAGVDEIVPWSAARCVAVWRGERGLRARDRWAATAREATKQSRRPFLPEVAPAAATTAELAGRATSATFVLHEEADLALTAVDLPEDGDLMLVVGPEGGVTGDELAAFASAGATPVRLGPEVLRTSTAGLAALCVLAVRLGRW
jgi:16S rRNA (uracil1498-N3)-methyltransferase